MFEPGEGAHFVAEVGRDLERHQPIKRDLPRQVHPCEPAGAELAQDLVILDDLPSRQHGQGNLANRFEAQRRGIRRGRRRCPSFLRRRSAIRQRIPRRRGIAWLRCGHRLATQGLAVPGLTRPDHRWTWRRARAGGESRRIFPRPMQKLTHACRRQRPLEFLGQMAGKLGRAQVRMVGAKRSTV